MSEATNLGSFAGGDQTSPDQSTPQVDVPATEVAPSATAGSVPENYRYWQEHGGEWADEYDTRKRSQPEYHIQEIMLAAYFANHAPARILEFGCGVGRHLSYLSKIPNLDVHGFDQSPTMIGECRRWATESWMDEHITLGAPYGRLPYDDNSFDIVYSAEVLVHVRPEHLLGTLGELLRIARGQVFHMETSEHHVIASGEHDGCWKHDLVAAYARLGHTCEMMPSGYMVHSPYRVVLDPSSIKPSWPPAVVGLLRRLEFDLVSGLREREERIVHLQTDLAIEQQKTLDAQEEISRLRQFLEQERARSNALEGQVAALETHMSRLSGPDVGRRLAAFMDEVTAARQEEQRRVNALIAERDHFVRHATQLLASEDE